MTIPKKIIWLASYPKSGNTWFRAFLTALLNEGEIDINDIKTDGIFSSRALFDYHTDLDSTLLTDEEVKLLQPEVFNEIARNYARKKLFVKVHDAYSFNELKHPIIPSGSTSCAVYIIRNPLDIASSLASHNNSSLDQAIDLLCNKNGCFATQKDNLNVNNQTRQLMYDWSGHVNSWMTLADFPVYFMRYEDMSSDPFTTFKNILGSMGETHSNDAISAAIEACRFEKLKEQETEKGFSEKPPTNSSFFRTGKSGVWRNELNDIQINRICSSHKVLMEKFNYFTPD